MSSAARDIAGTNASMSQATNPIEDQKMPVFSSHGTRSLSGQCTALKLALRKGTSDADVALIDSIDSLPYRVLGYIALSTFIEKSDVIIPKDQARFLLKHLDALKTTVLQNDHGTESDERMSRICDTAKAMITDRSPADAPTLPRPFLTTSPSARDGLRASVSVAKRMLSNRTFNVNHGLRSLVGLMQAGDELAFTYQVDMMQDKWS
ncbi:uncharacterized protein MKK02DRAFT_42920 [Dioszegia hungarica]|uniref:Uncharacterized protein n=1 Tax=Dioszegia hungarica TaxID=4972 RepID=A0AA38HFD1_9TREE|nr:uncharacterized protein MKK02DRAFT_42920 [Dioszegia hungarica]KAI9638524.1 hypothetical protein MKK02DRAFT_42920 [Dioszegia hungarica]